VRALNDADVQVRINALRSLGTFARPADAARVAPLADDAHAGVSVQAVETLGEVGGPDAVTALRRVMADKKSFAMRRQALLGLARVDTAAFREAAAPWAASRDWRERAVVAEAAGSRMPGTGAEAFLRDPDGRVVAAALQGWLTAGEGSAPALAAEARRLLNHPDAMVRANAAAALAKGPDAADVPALVASFRRAQTDSIPDASLNVLEALLAIAKASPEGRTAVTRDFLTGLPRPEDYLLRRWAEESWPEAADRWGAAYPVRTGRSLADYRELARRFVLPTSPERRQHVKIEVDQKGVVEVELFGDDAPLTVASFLSLADRRYFDGLRFHRVVPNFVVQDGDPRGDGNGGPGYALRDEINPNRYEGMVLGMALAGPDTGGSQWFVNLSPQPHLDGTYAVFGRVVSGQGTLLRVLQGDLIRTVQR
jgi:cyclophilin family peptidyl-prolyl cis-trans isomerase/HEAT repeat protein